MTIDLFGRWAVLFLPASNARAIAKARASRAEMVVLDLEDAVREEDKQAAREAAIAALLEPWSMPVGVRVNGLDTQWFDEDLAALANSRADFAVVPMVASLGGIKAARETCTIPVLAMIETAAGVLAAPSIARDADGLIVGVNDLAADLKLPAGVGRGPLQFALQSIIIAARAAGKPVFDGVFNRLDDPDGLAAECDEARRLGFDGKTLIHPDQIEACLAAFAPTSDEIARAERLIAAATGGAERFEGAMVEAIHVEAAKRLIARG